MSRLFPLARGASHSGDWIWGALGVCIAGTSASFAGYMIATAPSEVVASGSGDFNVFVHFDRRATHAADAAVPAAARRAGTAQQDAQALGIDLEPTGSIAAPPAAGNLTVVTRESGQPVLRDFVLRDVVGNKALIEHGKKLSLVRQGSVLDDAGEVLAIERRGGSWVVKTASGVIGGF